MKHSWTLVFHTDFRAEPDVYVLPGITGDQTLTFSTRMCPLSGYKPCLGSWGPVGLCNFQQISDPYGIQFQLQP